MTYSQNDKWTFIHIHDLKPLNDDYNKLKSQYENIIHSLNDEFRLEYHNYITTLNYSIQNIDETFCRIFPQTSRYKRGLINGLGSVVKSITGNLDAEDGERINKALELMETDQNNMHQLLSEQTSVMIDAIDELNKTLEGLTHNQKQIVKRIEYLQLVIEGTLTDSMTAYDRVQLLELFTQISSLLDNIVSVILTTENAITFSKLNTYHTSILKPKFISSELRRIENQIIDSRLITKDDITLYEKVFRIKSIQIDFKIIFQIEIPLVDTSDYIYYQLYSLPIPKSKNTFTMIIPQAKYLILNEQQYAFRNQPCQELGNQTYFCEEDNPTTIDSNSPCEIKLINFQKPINNCQQDEVKISKPTVSKYGNSQYIIVAPMESKAIIKCLEKEDTKIIHGTYMATLKPKCHLSINGRKYSPTQPMQETQQSFNLPTIELNTAKPLVKQEEIPELKLENVQLHDLNNIKSQLQSVRSRIPANINIPMYQASIWTIVLYIILVASAIFVIARFIVQTRKKKPKKQKDDIETGVPMRLNEPRGFVH